MAVNGTRKNGFLTDYTIRLLQILLLLPHYSEFVQSRILIFRSLRMRFIASLPHPPLDHRQPPRNKFSHFSPAVAVSYACLSKWKQVGLQS